MPSYRVNRRESRVGEFTTQLSQPSRGELPQPRPTAGSENLPIFPRQALKGEIASRRLMSARFVGHFSPLQGSPENHALIRPSRESGNPSCSRRTMGPRFRGDDADFHLLGWPKPHDNSPKRRGSLEDPVRWPKLWQIAPLGLARISLVCQSCGFCVRWLI